MLAARLRHRVTIEAPVEARGTAGSVYTASWSPVLERLPAAVEPLRGRELFAAQQLQSSISTRVRIRWQPDVTVTSKMRVVHVTPHGTRYYAIEGTPVHIEERCREIHLMCVEREADGWRT